VTVVDEGELVAGIIGFVSTAGVAIGTAMGAGTASEVLIPRLLSSVDPNGIPVPRPEPLAIDVGMDDTAGFVVPELHMLERPEVSIIAVVFGIAKRANAAEDVELDIAPGVTTLVVPLVASESPRSS
jgi:hypothetical protein